MAQCPFVLDEVLSAERGTAKSPYVFRCPKCGIITAPTKYSDPRRVRRRCRWFNPKVAGFVERNPCWFRGLGDVVHRVASILPVTCQYAIGRMVDRVETWLTGRAIAPEAGCAGCGQRRITLNRKFPLTWLRSKICAPVVSLSEAGGDRIPVCFVFPHGFGDAVQFTAVLRHLKRYRPLWDVTVYAKVGAHSLFDGLCARVGVMDKEGRGEIDRSEFALVYPVQWAEPTETYADSPSTKVERSLREEFGIVPDPDLWGYRVAFHDGYRKRAEAALAEIAERDGERFNVVAIHYQGNSWKESKNLDENVARNVVAWCRENGLVPLILDWEDPYRSAILRERTRGAKCFGKSHPIWGGLGTGDGAQLAAILSMVRLVVGIDSGPEHVAASSGTDTIVCWGKSHPVNYFAPADNVVHLVRADAGKYISGDRETGERFFRERYRFQEIRANLRYALPEAMGGMIYGSHSARRILDS